MVKNPNKSKGKKDDLRCYKNPKTKKNVLIMNTFSILTQKLITIITMKILNI